ncbi:uncharacterized protein LOC123870380 isoform X2 [Maniola jurtina]|uniref:uncharacterized protein LOC123870380 isoform X2 n=1 Tax=Maniola jurtina TaxID=191418 RepID=UPI001E68C2DB|nr:uncharacterized protein LOC123870380 isoform X2 [Maniola jurtina]
MMKKRNILAQFNNLNNFFEEFEPFSASPPAPDDSFFYIRYPKPEVLFGKPKFANELPTDQQTELRATYNVVKEKDWSKHTKPCQDVLHGIAPINTAVKSINLKAKPAGTDDGFKGEGAACGSSVVRMANQMISSTRSPRGFAVATPSDEASEPARPLAARRGSRSLPATPAHSPPGSPTARRKMNYNRYFTSPFEPVEDANNRSWLTMALLGFKKDINASTSTLAEEDALENRLHGTLAESVESLGPAPKAAADLKVLSNESKSLQPKTVKASPSILPKPSELREMNFWSPTSM